MNSVTIKLTLDNVSEFVKTAETFNSNIDIKKGKYTIDAKSLMGVMSIDCSEGVTAKIITSNEKELLRFINEMKRFQ